MSRNSAHKSDCQLIIWKKRGAYYHPSNGKEIDQCGAKGVLVCGCIMLGNRSLLHVFDAGSDTTQRYRDEVLKASVRFPRGAVGTDFLFLDDNVRSYRVPIVDHFLEEEDIRHRNWPAKAPDIIPIEHVWNGQEELL